MLPENLAITVTDVLNYHQKKEKGFVPTRTYSAISLRLKNIILKQAVYNLTTNAKPFLKTAKVFG